MADFVIIITGALRLTNLINWPVIINLKNKGMQEFDTGKVS